MRQRGVDPGEGAIEYARQFVADCSIPKARPILRRLIMGELHDGTDKRIKRCDWCGYHYRDITKNNSSRVCCRHCKYDKDNHAKAVKKADRELMKPIEQRNIEKEMYTYYAGHLEYPYYISEHYMLKRAHQRERPCSYDKIEQINAAKQRGYKRKNRLTPTDGNEKVHVRGLSHKHSYGEVEISYMSAEEIEEYYRSKYSEEHLRWERWRAQQFRCSKKLYI